MTKYADFGLRANPFSEERFDLPMIDRVSDWTRLKGVLSDQLGARAAKIGVLFGDYGMGKSFTMTKLEEVLKKGEEGFPRPADIVVVRFRTTEAVLPKNYIVDLFQRMIKDIGPERLRTLCSEALLHGGQFERSFGRFVTEWANGNDTAWDWILGRSLTAAQRSGLGVSYKITDYLEIHEVFKNTLRLLRSAGVQSLVMLLDELEFLLSLASRNKLLTILHEVQSIWDDYNQLDETQKEKHSKVLFVFASSIGSWEKFLEMAQEERRRKGGGGTETFLRRVLPSEMVTLSPLKKADVEQLLVERMAQYRVDGPKDPLHPFASDYVEFIFRLSFGIPSKVLAFSALVIEQSEIAPITAADAETILNKFGLLEEFLEAEK